jgi:sugar phosphate isomerase/epimerase
LEFASRTGSKHVSCLPGVRFDDEPARVSLGRCHDELAWRVERAAEQRLVLGVEAHIGSIAPVPAKALRLVEAVPGLTLTLDYTHFTLQGIADEEVAPLLPLASHFHVRGARKGRLQASFAENTIDYRGVLDGLAAAKYRGYLGLEYVWIDWQHCNEVDNLSETVLWRRFLLAHAGKKVAAHA